MGRNVEEKVILDGESNKDVVLEHELEESLLAKSQTSRPSSMVFKKSHSVIPAHLVAEAISTLHGLDLRWSGPITPSEMQYVQQYVFAKYPQYCNGLVEEDTNKIDHLDNLSIKEASSETGLPDEKRKSPKSLCTSILSDLDKTLLHPSRLLDILTKKSSFQGSFISIPEIQARNRALDHCGLSEKDYLVLFMPNYKDAMMMIGESYPFFRGNFYMTIISEELDRIREFAAQKESKVVAAPETWLDLRIKGSQLSQYFRRKCKHIPKGLFSYPVYLSGTRYSLHWISEAHRNSWHVLLDATGLVFGEERLALALHRPDFVLCLLDNKHGQPSKITSLLIRKKSFDTMASLA
ncbi:hypothetical protein F2P56_029790 [Juglans regia]|uniref:Molybdenum cofactor sulfurase-like n=2 Tax=Juglans regia TaxID=51240 RepID=A0A833TYM9_JUGRE|nr:molybdenum cofactor sulfurase-like [Juglans regia]KAF5449329.1 hypothetical protein F2P56_029790 [Juglans regia]